MKALALILAISSVAFGSFGLAAQTPESHPVIGGMTMTCTDFRGRAVQTLSYSLRGDVGRATFVSAVPVIALDPKRLASLPDKLQIFFYSHECAHHVLAHLLNPTPLSEREADCWSIEYGRAEGYFTRKDVEAFAPFLAHSKGSRFGHLPGPERHAYLLKCFDAPDTARASYTQNR